MGEEKECGRAISERSWAQNRGAAHCPALSGLDGAPGARGLVREGRFAFPLRLQHIADATGLAIVHVSRVTGTTRKFGLIELEGRFLTILNLSGLKNISNPD
jgi:hypothetical protein